MKNRSNTCSNVLSSGKHLLLLINQILDMAKVEAGKMKLALSSLPMKSILDEISMLVADMASKKKIEMSIEIAEDLPDIEADELKVKEIIYNLLSNAVKFTTEGGKLGMRAKRADSEIEVVVWDTGVGIAPENLERIFEGFFRVDSPIFPVDRGDRTRFAARQKDGRAAWREAFCGIEGPELRHLGPVYSAYCSPEGGVKCGRKH